MPLYFKKLTSLFSKLAHESSATVSQAPVATFKNLSSSAQVFIYEALRRINKSSLLALYPSQEECIKAYNDYSHCFGSTSAALLNPSDLESSGYIAILNQMHEQPIVVFSYAELVIKKCVSPESLATAKDVVKLDETDLSYKSLIALLRNKNFIETAFVYNPGEFAVRGHIIDLYSYAESQPTRIAFSGDKIKSIKAFEAVDQLSTASIDTLKIVNNPVSSATKSLLDVIPAQTQLCLWKSKMLRTVIKDYGAKSDYEDYEEALEKMNSFKTIHLDNDLELGPTFDFEIYPSGVFNNNFKFLKEELLRNKGQGISSYIVAPSELITAPQLNEIINGLSHEETESNLFYFIDRSLSSGFLSPKHRIAVYTYNEIFGKKTAPLKPTRQRITQKQIKHIFNEIQPGDYVSHIDHGIGRLEGVEKIKTGDRLEECLRIAYANRDLLYVNVHSLYKISKYTPKADQVALHKLGSGVWERIKSNTKKKIKDIGRELIALYAKRKFQEGFAFAPDSHLQHLMENSFAYEDTPDQITAMKDIKRDMERPHPMDRLICGDVGFGKTELAIRAAYKAFLSGKQVAVLAPTTLLTMQHTKTFQDRLKGLGVEVDFLNRFKNGKILAQTVQKLENGAINVIIGTHKLLGKNIKFQDLGLLIVDEEQKFGVRAKERIKNLKTNVDTLTLTATPIPRTLKYSLMGARDISVLNTPPANRKDVTTRICIFDKEEIKAIIERELARNGQVFVIHNRVSDIHKLAMSIQELVPEAKIVVGHGQMNAEVLENAINGFINKDYDVLVSTTIIEAGIDIPIANTMIINNAHVFGLSDLHQMRGRVGRSTVAGYCYLVIPGFDSLTPEAKERLFNIEEYSSLGSGLKIAMKDLDIRGAGNILGDEQSGFIADMGLDTYNKILNEAITELKSEEFSSVFSEEGLTSEYVSSTKIDTDQECFLPHDYIKDAQERYNIYMRLSRSTSESEVETIERELVDRFGPIRPQATALLLTIELQIKAKKLAIERISAKNNRLKLYLISNKNSKFYASKTFQHILNYALSKPQSVRLEETTKNLNVTMQGVVSLQEAVKVLDVLLESG